MIRDKYLPWLIIWAIVILFVAQFVGRRMLSAFQSQDDALTKGTRSITSAESANLKSGE